MQGEHSEKTRYSLRPELGGFSTMRASYVTQTFSRHIHEEYAVGFIERGAMAFRYRGSNLVASAGTVNLVVPGEAHDGHCATGHGWIYRMFYLPPELLTRAASELGACSGMPHFRRGVIEDPALARKILQTHRLLDRPASSRLEREISLLRMLTFWIMRHAEEPGRAPEAGHEPRAVRLAREYMHDAMAEDVGLDHLAGLSGLSRFHFARVFEKTTGISPHAYLLQTRVNRARILLETSARRLADIAAECGFADQSHLTRSFRRQFGLTPGHYRKIIQNSRA